MNLHKDEFAKTLRRCSHFIRQDEILGDYLEFGVFDGWSLRTMVDIKMQLKLNMRLFGFDSFKGFPDTNNEQYPEGDMAFDYNQIVKKFPRNWLNDKIHLVNGFFKDSLTSELMREKKLEKAAIINIDCDVYQSAKEALDFCTPLIQMGTILIFDDWFLFKGNPQDGEQRAFYEWSSKTNHYWVEYDRYAVHGKVFLCVGI